jgi:predicted phosphoribosyltransferase
VASLAAAADQVVVLRRPEDFGAVGRFYDDFTQISDAEVAMLLRDPPPSPSGPPAGPDEAPG